MPRIKPYTSNQQSWLSILQKPLKIPMNQREYSWETTEISKFLDDIFKIYEEDKYVEKMGSIINLNYNNDNDIYDGQQRILTTILILNVIGCLSSNSSLKNKINELLTINTELDDLTQEQEEDGEPIISSINGFELAVETEANGLGDLKRRFAVAKDSRGITLLKGEPSFSSVDQILIDELVFYIQQNDLKAV